MAKNENTNITVSDSRSPQITITGIIRQRIADFIKPAPAVKSFFSPRTWRGWFMQPYNGEKTLGELGPSKDYLLDYASLRSRGNQFYLDNGVAQIIINRMLSWVIGNGLQPESEPNELALLSEGIKIDIQKFSDQVEARWNAIAESPESSYSRMKNFQQLQRTGFLNSANGGGILVILRVRNGIVNYELIDGAHVRHFSGGTDLNPTLLENGNRISNGIEISDKGEHIAFWVQTANYEYKRILAKSTSTGLTMAFMYGGNEYRIDNTRTIPILSGIFQTLSQMDEYQTSTLASAKAQNDVAYQVISELNSTGDNPFKDVITTPYDVYGPDGTIPVDANLERIRNNVQVQTNKNTFALDRGQKIEPLQKNEAELYFEAFFRTLLEVSCAAVDMPSAVALIKFDTSYSSARATIKDWEHSLLLKRYSHGRGFCQPGYELQLHLDILTGKIQAPGYLKAFNENNVIVLSAYRQCRWVGDQVPYIDPVKEVEAERNKLGPLFAHAPLTTLKKSTEALNGGSSRANIKDAGVEQKELLANGLKPINPEPKTEFKPDA